MIALIVMAVIAAVVLFWGVGIYNGLVRLRNAVKNGWSQIDVQLKRRHDLIPNLVETAKGYMTHERETLENVTRARNLAQIRNVPISLRCRKIVCGGGERSPLPKATARPRSSAGISVGPAEKGNARQDEPVGRHWYPLGDLNPCRMTENHES